jgi:hypothetical protein
MRFAPKRAFSVATVTLMLAVLGSPTPAGAGGSAKAGGDGTEIRADLDGAPIKPVDVGHWYCHDFEYPVIHCFSRPEDLERSTSLALAATAVTYVTVYEFTFYQGPYMHISQDYSILALIGWSDRISSLVVHTNAGGVFWTDWLYSGTRYPVCCYQQLGSLGSFNDSFSSVFQN